MLGLVKIYIAMMVVAMVIVAGVGAYSIKRCGCHLYERYSVPKAENSCFWSVMLGSLFGIAIFIAQPVCNMGWTLTEHWGWSSDYGLLVGYGLASMVSLALGVLARFVFWAAKTVTVIILRKQQMHQREVCRELRKQLSEVDFKQIACEDLLELYINSRKEIIAHCVQPAPVKCPVGMDRRRFGYIDGQDLTKLMDIWKDKLFQMSAEREDDNIVSIVEPEFFDLDTMIKTSPATVMATVPFVSYYDDDQEVCLSTEAAHELQSFLNNFVEQTSHDVKSA